MDTDKELRRDAELRRGILAADTQQQAPPTARHWGLLSHPTPSPLPLAIEPGPPNPAEAVHLVVDARLYDAARRLVTEHNALVDEVLRLRVDADGKP